MLDDVAASQTAPAAPAAAPAPATGGGMFADVTNEHKRGLHSVPNIHTDPAHQGQGVWAGISNAAKVPAEFLNAVLGAPQRYVSGELGTVAGEHANLLQGAGNGLYDVFHPNDTKSIERHQAEGERALSGGALGNGEGLGKLGTDLTYQIATDPLTYLGGAGLIEKAATHLGVIDKLSHLIPGAFKGGEDVRKVFHNPGPLVTGVTGQQVPKYAANRDMYNTFTAQSGAIGRSIQENLMKVGDELKLHHTTNADHIPEGHNARYEPNQLIPQERPQFTKAYNEAKAAGLDEKSALWKGYQAGAQSERNDMLTAAMIAKGAHPEQVAEAIKAESAYRNSGLHQALTSAPWHDAGEKLSDTSKRMMFVNPLPHMVGNVAPLTYAAGGMGTLVDGLKMFATGVPKALEHELHANGASMDIFKEPDFRAQFQKSGFGQALWNAVNPGRATKYVRETYANPVLDKFETAMRAAMWKYYAKRNPGARPVDIAAMVRDAIGDYQNSPAYVKALKDIGGVFPQYHAYIVPKAVGRAVINNPQRVEGFLRTQNDINDDVINTKEKADKGEIPKYWQLGGAINNFAKFTTTPATALGGEGVPYLTSTSNVGPIASSLLTAGAPQSPEDTANYLLRFGGRVGESALGYLPLGMGEWPLVNGKGLTDFVHDVTNPRRPGQAVKPAQEAAQRHSLAEAAFSTILGGYPTRYPSDYDYERWREALQSNDPFHAPMHVRTKH